MAGALSWRGGGCHCGAVRFRAALPDEVEAQTCTCSICEMTGFVHVIVPKNRFDLTSGEGALSTYTFNTVVGDVKFGKDGEWSEARVMEVQFRDVKSNDVAQFKEPSTEVVL